MHPRHIIESAADTCAREHLAQYTSSADIPEAWRGDIPEADLDYVEQQVGRPLEDDEAITFGHVFRETFHRLSAGLKGAGCGDIIEGSDM